MTIRPTEARIDLGAISGNVRTIRELVAPAEVCAVVKADGYGHGAEAVARAAIAGGATWLAVALVEEGRALRAAGLDAPILVLAEPPPEHAGDAIDADLAVAVYSREFAQALDRAAAARGRTARAHLKVDTGMHRVGVPAGDVAEVLQDLPSWSHVEFEALWTHLAVADEPGNPATAEQLSRLDSVLALADERGVTPRLVHAGNSAGALIHPASRRDLVRIGIAMYGLSPSEAVVARDHGLRPALELRSEVAFVKRVPAGAAVSYGHTWVAPRDGWLATLPIGYADGVPRVLSNRAAVIIDGQRRPVVGTVCMDQLLVWCDDHRPDRGAEAVLIGARDGVEVTAEEWAGMAGTISYEIVCGIGARVPREYGAPDAR